VSTIQLVSNDDFTNIRQALTGSGFTEREAARRLGMNHIADFENDADREQIEPYQETAVGTLIRLFIEGRFVNERLLRDRIGNGAVDAMFRAGLITMFENGDGNIGAAVALYDTVGVYIISDRWNTPDRSAFPVQPDIVYPAIVANAQNFLAFLPDEACDDFLDLCSGTGVAALSAARRFARRAWACDVAERATLFAEFNARLNGLENVTTVTGDLYEPVNGLQFDRIVAHPPYVPVLRPKYIYHDGGEDGETISRRIVASLPRFLKPGGLLYMVTSATDRMEAPLERRIRGWLGEAESDFDVALIPRALVNPEEFSMTQSVNSSTPREDLKRFRGIFERDKVQHLVNGMILVQRKTSSRTVFTVRRQASRRTTLDSVRSMLTWETAASSPDATDHILNARARCNPELELHVSHKMTDEGWAISQYRLQTGFPFSMDATTDAWAPFLVGMCDGSKTLRQHFEDLKAQEALPATARPDEFARAVSVLISGGFILLE
jgi:methylase of polypeptide subunit release factors